jgi:hypothetical protein
MMMTMMIGVKACDTSRSRVGLFEPAGELIDCEGVSDDRI